MTKAPASFVSAFLDLGTDVTDAVLDALVKRHFSILDVVSPEIVRSFLRQRIGNPDHAAGLWDALHTVAADVAQLNEANRGPDPIRNWAPHRTTQRGARGVLLTVLLPK